MAVLVNTMRGAAGEIVVERHTIDQLMCALGGATCAIASKLESVPVADGREQRCVAIVPCPAIANDHRGIALEQIPAIVGVSPATATHEHVALPGVQFAGERIGVLAVRWI